MYSARHKNKDKTIKPVIFMLCIFNQTDYPGFRLDNEKYTAYPDEEEILLPSGTQVELEEHKVVRMGEHYIPKEG